MTKAFEAETMQDMIAELSSMPSSAEEVTASLEAMDRMNPILSAASLHRVANALESIADSLKKIANPKLEVGDHERPSTYGAAEI